LTHCRNIVGMDCSITGMHYLLDARRD